MARSRNLTVVISGDANDAMREFKRVNGALDGMGKKGLANASRLSGVGSKLATVGKVGAAAMGGLATASVAFGGKAVLAASDLNEAISATTVVFGDFSDGVFENADMMAEKFGISKQAFLEGASGLGSLIKAGGASRAEASKMSVEFTKLAADLSSMRNIPLPEALGAIRSGLSGEAEPLKRFGVLLNEASVQAEAVRLGLIKEGDELTEQAKVQARASLITKGLSDAHGDLARTADSPANAMRRLKGQLENVMISVGQGLLPAFSAVLPVISELVPVLGRSLGGVLKALAPALMRIAKVLGPVLSTVIDALAPVVGVLATALADVLVALLPLIPSLAQLVAALAPILPPLGQLIAALVGVLVPVLNPLIRLLSVLAGVLAGGLGDALGWVARQLGDLGGLWDTIWRGITGATRAAVRTIVGVFRGISDAITDAWNAVQDATMRAWDAVVGTITRAIGAAIGFIKRNWTTILAVLTGPIGLAALAIARNFDKIKRAVAAVLGWIGRNWRAILTVLTGPVGIAIRAVARNFDKVKTAVGAVIGWVRRNWRTILTVITGPVGIAVRLVGRHFDTIRSRVASAIRVFRSLPGRIVGAFAGLGRTFLGIGRSVMDGILDGIKAGGRAILQRIPSLLRRFIPGPIKRFFGISSPSKMAMGWGRAIADGMAIGIEKGTGRVAGAARSLAQAGGVDAPRAGGGALVGARAAAAGAGGGDVHVYLQGAVLGDTQRVVDTIRRELLRTSRRNGSPVL